jgi:DNA-nicking Smr family endonuclease
MKPPRGLSAEDAALWRRVTATVKPLHRPVAEVTAAAPPVAVPDPPAKPQGRVPPPSPSTAKPEPPPVPGLDGSWERKLAKASIRPDFTLDLHGHTLEQAHRQLDHGLTQAKGMGARMVLLITGKPRPADPADRGHKRGAIRAKVLDWLAAGPHAGDIAAIRQAHRRHGGDGALYLVLKRRR